MARLDPDYVKNIDMYLNADDDAEPDDSQEEIEETNVKGNIPASDVQMTEQALLYVVIDKSFSVYNSELEKQIKKGLEAIEKFIDNPWLEEESIQTAVTFFGADIEMHPFRYLKKIEVINQHVEYESHLYDAIVESCKNMLHQYECFEPITKVTGYMINFSDGQDNGSERYTLNDMQNYLKKLNENGRKIEYIVSSFKGIDNEEIGRKFRTQPILIDDIRTIMKLMKFEPPCPFYK